MRPATRPSEIIKWADEGVLEPSITASTPAPIPPVDFADAVREIESEGLFESSKNEPEDDITTTSESLCLTEQSPKTPPVSEIPPTHQAVSPIRFEDAFAESVSDWEEPDASLPTLDAKTWNFSIGEQDELEADHQSHSLEYNAETSTDLVAESEDENEEERLARKQQELQDRLSRLTSSIKSHN